MRAPLTPAARLHRPSEYAHALKGRRVARGALFVLHVSQTDNPSQQARLGLIIAKRFAPKAVTRNTIKRILREAFRHQQHQLAPRDYVFRLYKPVSPCSLTQLKRIVRAEADILLDKAKR